MPIDVKPIFVIFAIGMIVAIVHTVLRMSGKEDFAYWATLTGFVLVAGIVITHVASLYHEITSVFLLNQ
jgi:stage III sporulation protein AC